MKNEITIFTNAEFGEIRTIENGGQAYFCLADICRILDLDNASYVKERLDKDGVLNDYPITDCMGRGQKAAFINEPNLYRCIFTSRKPEAKQFQGWVFNEVLPSIRKHGLYAVDELIANPDLAIKAFEALKQERAARLEAERKNAVLMHVNKTYTATEIAKEMGLKSANELNRILEERGIQYKTNNTWVPKSDYADKGFFEIKQEVMDNGSVIYHRRITQDGRTFILELLNNAA